MPLRKALEQKTSQRKHVDAKRRGDLTLTFLLLTGVTLLLQFSLLGSFSEAFAMQAIRGGSAFHLALRSTARDSQIQPFLEALLALPQVANVQFTTKEETYERSRANNPESISFFDVSGVTNPYVDSINVMVRSPSHHATFLAFLQRPELQSVLEPQAVFTAQERSEELRSAFFAHRLSRTWFVGFSAVCLLLVVFLSLQAVRSRFAAKRVEFHLAHIAGANAWFLQLPFLLELVVLLLGALLIATLILGLLMGFLPHLFPTTLAAHLRDFLHVSPWLLLSELVLLGVIALFATKSSLRFAHGTQQHM